MHISKQRGSVPTGSDTSTVLPALTDALHALLTFEGYEPNPKRRRRTRPGSTTTTRGQYQINRRNEEMCGGFQSGKCTHTTDGLHCAANPSKVHQCAYCKRQGHGKRECWLKKKGAGRGAGAPAGSGAPPSNNLPWMRGGKDKGGGRGRGGGKGGNNGGKAW